MPVGPTKVKAHKSVLFSESTLGVNIKITCLIQLTHFILSHFAPMVYVVAKCSHSTFTYNYSFPSPLELF